MYSTQIYSNFAPVKILRVTSTQVLAANSPATKSIKLPIIQGFIAVGIVGIGSNYPNTIEIRSYSTGYEALDYSVYNNYGAELESIVVFNVMYLSDIHNLTIV